MNINNANLFQEYSRTQIVLCSIIDMNILINRKLAVINISKNNMRLDKNIHD